MLGPTIIGDAVRRTHEAERSAYLHAVGRFYKFFGVGMALYFAPQGLMTFGAVNAIAVWRGTFRGRSA
jgi:hypothetical protein